MSAEATLHYLTEVICYIELSCIGIGILNLECAVLPPANNSVAIPDDATANAIFPWPLTVDKITSIKNVYHILQEH